MNYALGISGSEIERSEDPAYDYYPSEFDSYDELSAEWARVAEQVEGEGIVLLKNLHRKKRKLNVSMKRNVKNSARCRLIRLICIDERSGAADLAAPSPTQENFLIGIALMLFAFCVDGGADLPVFGRRHAILGSERAVEARIVAEAVGAANLGDLCAGADCGGAGGETLFCDIPMDRKPDALLKEMSNVILVEIKLLRNAIQRQRFLQMRVDKGGDRLVGRHAFFLCRAMRLLMHEPVQMHQQITDMQVDLRLLAEAIGVQLVQEGKELATQRVEGQKIEMP